MHTSVGYVWIHEFDTCMHQDAISQANHTPTRYSTSKKKLAVYLDRATGGREGGRKEVEGRRWVGGREARREGRRREREGREHKQVYLSTVYVPLHTTLITHLFTKPFTL